jgi:hypothetical protein
MHDFAQFIGCGRKVGSDNFIASFHRSQVMAYRANSANPWREDRHLAKIAPVRKDLKAPELRNVKLNAVNGVLIIKMDRYFAMSLNAGNGIYYDRFTFIFHNLSLPFP